MTDAMFAAPGRFWRGNLHTHSNRSDGVLDPEEVCRRYRDEGYDFIALTDHLVGLFDYPITDTTAFRDTHFTTLFGAEIHSGAMENGELWHLVAIGLPANFTQPDVPDFTVRPGQETGPALAARARAAGAFVAIAHPEWSGLTTADARSIEAAHAVEVYNHSSGVGSDRAHGFYTLDQLLSDGRHLALIATDDAHFAGDDHFGGWVMVKAAENTPDALLTALKSGHFYASQGPDFEGITWGEDVVTVECSPVTTIIIQGQGSASQVAWAPSLTRAEIPLERCADSPWLRVTIVDQDGKRAWSNPVRRD